MIYALAGIAIAAVAAFFLLRNKSASVPSGWTADTDGNNYGAVVDATGSFEFPLAPSGVHYVTKAAPPLRQAITLRYRIDADPGVAFVPSSDPKAPAIGPTLYFQRKGDDWSGQGQFETYRWWATFAAAPLTPGEHLVTAMFSDLRWTAVETSDSYHQAAEFIAALDNAERVGFTFGGGTGYGHGVYATGKARFTLEAFTVS